jgi:glutamate dehydrogenase
VKLPTVGEGRTAFGGAEYAGTASGVAPGRRPSHLRTRDAAVVATAGDASQDAIGIGGDDAGPADSGLEQPTPDVEHLIAETVAIARRNSAGGADLAGLVALYWRLAAEEELTERTPEELLAATLAHRELGLARRSGQTRLRLTRGQEGDHSVLEIVTDDMPFLVDSVTGALTARGLEVRLMVHPVVVVRRDAHGELQQTRPDVEPQDAEPGDVVESWIRVEVNHIPDEWQLQDVRDEVARVLADVRAAVGDWQRMRAQALALADELADARLPVPDTDVTDAVELLRWLVDDHFTFLGYREYRLRTSDDGQLTLNAVPGTGLGILRADTNTPRLLSTMTPGSYAKIVDKRLLIITKANSRATVHRTAYLDYIAVKEFDAAGNAAGERRFLGLFGRAAYRTSVRELPVVRRRVDEVVERSGLSLRGHSGKELMELLETYPRDDLFQISTAELYETAMGVLRLAGRRQVRLFLHRDVYGRFISCLVCLPRDRFTAANQLRIQEILLRELNGIGVDCTTRVGESDLARLHFTVRTDPIKPPSDIDIDGLARTFNDATRLWDSDFRLLLEHKLDREQAKRLYHRYSEALPGSYKDEHQPYEAATDAAKMELLDEPGQLAMYVYRRRQGDRGVRVKIFRYREPMVLSAVLPVPHSLGLRVTDERPYEVKRSDGMIYVYDFGLQLPAGSRPLVEVRAQMEKAFAAAWRGAAEIDGYNALVLTAGLTWRQVAVLRAYARYLHQTGTVYSQEYMEQTFVAHPDIAANLVELFEARFDPRRGMSGEDRSLLVKGLAEMISGQLDAVTSLDQDRILRRYLALIQATRRTSFFQRGADGRFKAYIAVKLDPQLIPDLPAPRPRYEIFVYSPRFEGVHLRFGPVARGGLRWSDRRDDFRTEILGLVKAQMVKNAVIVPTGAKGGFVLKRPVTAADREAYQAEGVACYQLFISALLDVTDNLDGGKIVPPLDVVRHDGDDPYLVVAADKGTATFSDIANEISQRYGHWLGDALASGGSAGYDHKKIGITAKGAWESVRRHLRELGMDIQTQDFTVVGIGDMSGDVFGNGMLLSRHIRLVAAFDHRHIFVDPTPDAGSSYLERRRLFDLPRSSWDDYDRSLISPGGGVWPRTAKSVPISPQVRTALSLPEQVTALTPVELIRAILKAPADLLWSGGIGTYVKASAESHLEAGDKANDQVRVNGNDLRVRAVAEGGNLGLTQPGRVEYALRGGRINADFIDNSAGVNCSDREVNIKILLNTAIRVGELDRSERNALLAEMTDEVGELVLRDNYTQAWVLGNSRARAQAALPVHRRMIDDLERRGLLDRVLEAVPDDEALATRAAAGTGLTSPELAVLLAYTKIAIKRDVGDSPLCDEAWTAEVLADYFPAPLRDRYGDQMADHPLRREIVTNQLVNEAVNRGGISFLFRAMEETGASAADVLRAYVVVRDVFGLDDVWQAVESLDNKVPIEVQISACLETRRLFDRAVRWLVSNRPSLTDVKGEIERIRPGVRRLLPELGTLLRGRDRQAFVDSMATLVNMRVPDAIADAITRIGYGFGLLDVVEIAHTTGGDINEIAGVYFALSDRFHVNDLLSKISALPREDRWHALARMALRYDLYAALAGLTVQVLATTPAHADARARVAEWEQTNVARIASVRDAIGELRGWRADLAALSVLLRQIRTLVVIAVA